MNKEAALHQSSLSFFEVGGKSRTTKGARMLYFVVSAAGLVFVVLGISWWRSKKKIKKTYERAAALTRKSAEQGDAEAECELGKMYYLGRGIKQDYKQALYWFRKAVEQGYARAQCSLGVMYAAGKGAPQDDKQAVAWFRKAAEQGYPVAQDKLGRMYYLGRGVPQDYAQGYMWVNIAAAQRDENAIKFRDKLEETITPSQIAEGQRLAREWLTAHPQAGGG